MNSYFSDQHKDTPYFSLSLITLMNINNKRDLYMNLINYILYVVQKQLKLAFQTSWHCNRDITLVFVESLFFKLMYGSFW